MKRALTMALVLALALGLAPMALAQEETAAPKLTPMNERISTYTTYLEEVFGEDAYITHVGLADVNRDKFPELVYIVKEGGESVMHFAYYDEGDVCEYEFDLDTLGKSPTSISLVRRRRVNSSEHCWVLQLQSKDEEKWNQRLFFAFQRSGDSLTGEMKFYRRWKSSRNMYYVDDIQTIKNIYNNELKIYDNAWPEANTDPNIKSRGIIRKVPSPKKWLSVRKTLSTAFTYWDRQ